MAVGSVLLVLAAVVLQQLTTVVVGGKHDVYAGYTVHGVELRDHDDLKILSEFEIKLNIDIWQYGLPGKRDALVMVPEETRLTFLDQLDENGITHYLYVGDVVKRLNDHDEEIARWRDTRSRSLVPFEDYPRYAEVDAYLESIAARYPNIVTLVNAGSSFEGRSVKYLKISTTNFTDTSKPVYFIDAMLHAREWVTTPVALYSIHRLVEDLNDSEMDLLENVDWIIMPLVNPDGYEYSHTDVRLWRRTRSFNPEVSTTCYGVDANRNFDVSWNTTGVSTDPCSNVYPGSAPFSEPETGYVRDVLHEYRGRIQLFLDVHSHGNLVLFAYGNASLPENAVHIHHVAAAMGAAIDVHKLPNDSLYIIGNSALVLYGTSGSAQDYGQHAGVPFSYTLELPGYGYAFLVPPQYIEHINYETWQGIVASARLSVLYYRAASAVNI